MKTQPTVTEAPEIGEKVSAGMRAAKAAGMISVMFLISRLLGFVRENISGRLFDRFQTDAYFAAFLIPDLMYYLLIGGALSAAFIPIFTEYLAKGEEEEGWKVASTFMNIVVLLLAGFTVFGVLNAEALVPLEAPDFTADKLKLLIELTRIMFPAVCFTALAGMVGGALNSYQSFFAPALGPVFYNIAIIVAAFFLGPRIGIHGMAYGVVVGAIGNFLIQLLFLRRVAPGRYRFAYIDLKNQGFRRMLALMVPALIGLSATQINLWATTAMASSLPEGSITALRFANRLILLPIGIFAAGVATAFFPMLSTMVARKEMNSFKDSLALALRVIFFIMLPSAVGLIVLRQPIVKLLFEGQKFGADDTALTAYALLFYSLALFAHAAILMIPRAFYALKDTITPVVVSIISVTISIGLNWIFLHYTRLGVGGFALSFSIMGLINMTALLFVLRRKINGIRGRDITNSFLKTMAASLALGGMLYLTNPLTISLCRKLGISGHSEAALLILIGGILGGGAFLVTAWLLRMKELELALSIIRRKLKQRRKYPEGAGA